MTLRNIRSLIIGLGFIAIAIGGAVAETESEWAPGRENDAETCRHLWGAVGLPRDTRSGRDTTIVCHSRFALLHDNKAKTPDWVIERLTRRQVSGRNSRPSTKFKPEPRVPPHGRAIDDDYPPRASGFARGHMAPSEDFNINSNSMKDTFVLSNAIPQRGARFNGAIWGTLEDEVRKAAKARRTIVVITGPVRGTAAVRNRAITEADNSCGDRIVLDGPPELMFCAANNDNPQTPCTNGVDVPIALYKIIYDPNTNDVFAFVLPNRDHQQNISSRDYLEEFRVSVAVIENLTGLQFLRGLSASKQRTAIKRCTNRTLW